MGEMKKLSKSSHLLNVTPTVTYSSGSTGRLRRGRRLPNTVGVQNEASKPKLHPPSLTRARTVSSRSVHAWFH